MHLLLPHDKRLADSSTVLFVSLSRAIATAAHDSWHCCSWPAKQMVQDVFSSLQVQRLAGSATALLASPRPSDSDGGAHILALLLRKYVLGLGWQLKLAASQPQHAAALPNGSLHAEGTAPAASVTRTAAGTHMAYPPRQEEDGSHSALAAGVAFLDQLCDGLQVCKNSAASPNAPQICLILDKQCSFAYVKLQAPSLHASSQWSLPLYRKMYRRRSQM